jgi:hypothetical protein
MQLLQQMLLASGLTRIRINNASRRSRPYKMSCALVNNVSKFDPDVKALLGSPNWRCRSRRCAHRVGHADMSDADSGAATTAIPGSHTERAHGQEEKLTVIQNIVSTFLVVHNRAPQRRRPRP